MAFDTADKSQADHATTGNIAADRLKSIVERIERLEEERKALGSDIKDIYAEAKSAGFDATRQIYGPRSKSYVSAFRIDGQKSFPVSVRSSFHE
ncbi:MAG: hypothetical protein B7Z67_06515 [Acidiphilium sp. 21-60-14]|nr:MAG: hypothetical protein B7Z67_06515 [Acidiphilium sp. 21-60-14]